MAGEIRVVQPNEITVEDVLSCQRLWAKHAASAPGSVFRPESAMLTMKNVADKGICIRRGSGLAGAMFHPFPWNHEYKVGYIVFWFFDHPRDMKIFTDICRLCTRMGANTVSVASHFPENRIGRYYEKLGFVRHEAHWLCSRKI